MKNRTKFMSIVVCLLLTLVSVVGTVGCGPVVNERVDKTKTQLYIATYGGGYGTKFLEDLKQRFEAWALENEKHYEEGKTGVQIFTTASKSKYTANALTSLIATDKYEVYFLAGDSMSTYRSAGSVKDITSAITSPNQFNENGESIESYLRPEMKAHHNVGDTTSQYYSLPFIDGGSGLTYDIDVFESNELYFDIGGCPSEFSEFVQANNADALDGEFEGYAFTNGLSGKSAGPDGLYGTDDDGLPATFVEFERLLAEMKEASVTSLIWSGEYESEYSPFLARTFSNKYHGFEEASILKDAGGENGRATTIITGFDNDGNPILKENHIISKDNIADVTQQAGYYYGLKLYEMILDSGTVDSTVWENWSHTEAQYRYVFSGPDKGIKDIAFLLDGVWWENEADSAGTFTDCANRFGKEVSRANRRFGYFPMPWVDETQIGRKNTIAGGGGSFIVANRVDDAKMEMISDFIQFAYSYESLQRMTINVGIPTPFIYEMDGINPDNGKTYYDSMSSFTRSFYNVYKNSDVVYGFIDEELSGLLKGVNLVITYMSSLKENGKENMTFPSARHSSEKVSAEDYFLGLYRKAIKN